MQFHTTRFLALSCVAGLLPWRCRALTYLRRVAALPGEKTEDGCAAALSPGCPSDHFGFEAAVRQSERAWCFRAGFVLAWIVLPH